MRPAVVALLLASIQPWREAHVEDPGWRQVEAAIRELNGRDPYQVRLVVSETEHMVIAGEPGAYHVLYYEEEGRIATLDLPERKRATNLPESGRPGWVAFQGNYVPASEVCASPELALVAARAFWRTGELAPALRWQIVDPTGTGSGG